MKRFEQESAPFEVEIPRSAGELIYVRNILEKKISRFSKHALSSKSPEKLVTYFHREDPKRLKPYLTYKKESGREAALNYSLGRIGLKDDIRTDMEFNDMDLTHTPNVRSTKSIIEARDLSEKAVRESLGEMHMYNIQFDFIPVFENDTGSIKVLGSMLETVGKLEGIKYALSEDNDIAKRVEEAKHNNTLPVRLFPTP